MATDAKPEVMIEIADLHKSFGALEVLKGISLEVRRGAAVALLGPMIEITSPLATVSAMPRSTSSVPNLLPRPAAHRIGGSDPRCAVAARGPAALMG